MNARRLTVVVVHNRYRSAQPSGEDAVVDQETSLLRQAGHEVHTFERRSDDIAAMPLARKATVPLTVPANPAVRGEFTAWLRHLRPDVVHIHNTFPLISPSVVTACARQGVPTVATLHNYQMICPPGTLYRDGGICTDCVGTAGTPAVLHGCYRDSKLASAPVAVNMVANRRRWLEHVDRFFCISSAQRAMLIQSGMPARRLGVKHNFVPEPHVRRSGPGEHLLYVGRMTEEKGIRLLMSAWDRVAADGGVGVPLVLAGTGPLSDEVAAWAADRADMSYHGLLGRGECAELIARSVAVVAPSLWLEAFGLVAVEAMAAGVPPVAAAHGAFVELVDDGGTGLLHDVGDAGSLARCLCRVADPEYNTALGRAARQRYERDFSPTAGLANLVAGYEAALTGAGEGEPV